MSAVAHRAWSWNDVQEHDKAHGLPAPSQNNPCPETFLGAQTLDAGVTAQVCWVTPEVAFRWKATGRFNRPLNENVVLRYARDMKADEWFLNGDTIVFDCHGILRNGFHRLEAIILSGVPIRSLVVHGVEPECFRTFDMGYRRAPNQIFSMMGEHYAVAMAAGTALLWRLEQGRTHLLGGLRYAPTMADRLAVLEKYPDFRTSVEYVVGSCGKLTKFAGSTAVATALHHLAFVKHGDHANAFYDALTTGEDLSARSPILALRNTLLEIKAAGRRPRQHETLGWWLPALNLWLDGKAVPKRGFLPIDWRAAEIDLTVH